MALFATDPVSVDLYNKPLARNSQVWRADYSMLLDGPGAIDGSGRTVYSYAHPLFWAPYSVIGDGGGT